LVKHCIVHCVPADGRLRLCLGGSTTGERGEIRAFQFIAGGAIDPSIRTNPGDTTLLSASRLDLYFDYPLISRFPSDVCESAHGGL